MDRQIIDLDVREILRAKGEPFQDIMKAVTHVGQTNVFQLHATFLPEPLFRVLGKLGFGHVVAKYADDYYAVQFCRDKSDIPVFYADLRDVSSQEVTGRTQSLLSAVGEFEEGKAVIELWLTEYVQPLQELLFQKQVLGTEVGKENGYVRVQLTK